MTNRSEAAKKAARTRKLRAAGRKAARTRKLRAAGRKAALARKRRAAGRTAATRLENKRASVPTSSSERLEAASQQGDQVNSEAESDEGSFQTRNERVAERERRLREGQVVRVEPFSGTGPQGSLPDLPDTNEYVTALTVLGDRITHKQRELLSAHWSLPEHVATATELARATGLSGYGPVNAIYGRLGTLLRQEMGYHERGQQSYIISWFEKPERGDWRLHMHPQVAAALEELGWVKRAASPSHSESLQEQ